MLSTALRHWSDVGGNVFLLELKMELLLKSKECVPDSEVWVSPKTYDDPFSRNTKEFGASTNISRDAIACAIKDGIVNKESSGEIANRVLKVISQQHPC